jgi:hypothetical protein
MEDQEAEGIKNQLLTREDLNALKKPTPTTLNPE